MQQDDLTAPRIPPGSFFELPIGHDNSGQSVACAVAPAWALETALAAPASSPAVRLYGSQSLAKTFEGWAY